MFFSSLGRLLTCFKIAAGSRSSGGTWWEVPNTARFSLVHCPANQSSSSHQNRDMQLRRPQQSRYANSRSNCKMTCLESPVYAVMEKLFYNITPKQGKTHEVDAGETCCLDESAASRTAVKTTCSTWKSLISSLKATNLQSHSARNRQNQQLQPVSGPAKRSHLSKPSTSRTSQVPLDNHQQGCAC